jgi:hypothetical protein
MDAGNGAAKPGPHAVMPSKPTAVRVRTLHAF